METISFHQLYEAYAKEVFRYALWLCGNTADAEDITMTVFFRAWVGEPVKAASARSYLMTIARNLVLDNRRKAWRQQPLEGAHEQMHCATANQETQQQLRQTLAALRELPEPYRTPLQMWAAGGLAYDDIAAAVGTTVAVVKVRIHRARQLLAERMNQR